MRFTPVIALFAAIALFAGCSHSRLQDPKAGSPRTVPLSGTVAEVLDGGGYTYLLMESGQTRRWAAIPKATVQVGEQVELRNGMEMHNVESKALGRTFDVVIFSEGLKRDVKDPLDLVPSGHAKMFADDTGEIEAISGTIMETMNNGGYTYAAVERNRVVKWVAVPQTEIRKGENLTFKPGTVMKNFKSRTLDRTFDAIVFSEGIAPALVPQPAAHGVPEEKQEFALQGISGKVVEATDVGEFTYAAVEKDGKTAWVAIPRTRLEVGKEAAFLPGEIKRNMPSRKMNRTFEEIQFSKGLVK